MDEEATKKKKKKNRNNQKPTLAISSLSFHTAVGSQIGNTNGNGVGVIGSNTMNSNSNHPVGDIRDRTASLSSSNDGSSSPPASASSDMSISPIHNGAVVKKQKSRIELYSERIR